MDLDEDYSDCPVYEPYHQDVVNSAFSVSRWMCRLITVLGLIGNITSISVLVFKFKRRRRVFHNLLIVLAIFDASFVLMTLIKKEFPLTGKYNDLVMLFPYLIYPWTTYSFRMSIFMTVAIATERYLAVTHPDIHGKKLLGKTWPYVLAACLLSFLSASTKLLELEVVTDFDGQYQISPSALRLDTTYAIVTMLWETFLSGIVPFFMLCYMNTHIYIYVRRTNKLMAQQEGGKV